MNIPDLLAAFWVGLCIVGTIAILTFGAVSCNAEPNTEKLCILNGGSWLVSDNTTGDYADYECQM